MTGLSASAACGYVASPPITPTTGVDPTAVAPQIGITIPVETSTASPVPTAAVTETTSFVPFIHYMADIQLDLNTHIIIGTLLTTYRNVTAAPLSEIVFRIVPAETPDLFTLTTVSTDSTTDAHTLNDSRLTIILHAPLMVGDSLKIKISFILKIPALPPASSVKNGYFGYNERQINLGDWLPTVAPNIDGDWLFPHNWPAVGETTVTESSSYVVTLNLRGTEANKQIVAAPGAVEQLDPITWRFTLDHGRNFALSISHDFVVRHVTTVSGIAVELYSFGQSVTHVFDFALDTAQDALTRYSQLFGPCPYDRLVLVEGDFPDGMEFSGLVFISTNWFVNYPNKPESWLMLIVVHELSHQWWYSSVGDDQSRTPFMDEAFAVYSELLYVEQTYPGQDEWWWTFRVKSYQPQGYVDSTVYDFNGSRPYINAVYLRGALFLNEIRSAIGDGAFMTWLRDYARTQADKITSPGALWVLLSAENYAKIAPIRARYLKIPDPLDNPAITAAATLDILPSATSTVASPTARKP